MVKKILKTISLDKEIVDRAMVILQRYGGKKSSLLNELLTNWVIEEEKKWEKDG